MGPREMLVSRVKALETDIGAVTKAFDLVAIPPDIRGRAKIEFHRYLNKQAEALAGLSNRLETLPDDGTREAWNDLRSISRECDALFSRCLAFVAGFLIREAKADNGVVAIAEALLTEIHERVPVEWLGITIPGNEALFDRVAGIVRLPFPGLTVWSLPAVGHEFGHVTARQLRGATVLKDGADSMPVIDTIRDMSGGRKSRETHLHELFADAFAAYVLGPCVYCYSVILMLDPVRAFRPGTTHPKGAARAHVIRGILEKMGDSRYGVVTDPIQALWEEASTRSQGSYENIASKMRHGLDAYAERFYETLATELPDARYAGWGRAVEICSQLLDAAAMQETFDDIQVSNDAALADVVNAAWRYRVTAMGESAERVHEVAGWARRSSLHLARQARKGSSEVPFDSAKENR